MFKEEYTKEAELRYDLLNDDWVIIAPSRANRTKKEEKSSVPAPCPFCNIETQESPTLIYSNGKKVKDLKDWTTVCIPNKYPVFIKSQKEGSEKEDDFYLKIKSAGLHELVVTRDHEKNIAHLPLERAKEVFDCYQDRIKEFRENDFVDHVFLFHNSGKEAGSTQPHPHSQILSLPLIDKEFRITLERAEKYFKEKKECLYCTVDALERENKERIVLENEHFIAYCPFAPKFHFQVIISPKKHSPRFEDITEEEKLSLAEMFQKIILKLEKGFNNPPFNFYLDNSPFDKDYSYYHWHWTIFPRVTYWAGFELGANMQISSITPEAQAEFLRNQ